MQTLTYRVLAILGAGDADGTELLQRLRELDADAEPSLPTLYRTLRDGIDRGWVEIAEVEDPAGRGRPPRRYRLTAEGVAAVRAEAERLRELAELAPGDDLPAHAGGGG